jgi:hypothetical protein
MPDESSLRNTVLSRIFLTLVVDSTTTLSVPAEGTVISFTGSMWPELSRNVCLGACIRSIRSSRQTVNTIHRTLLALSGTIIIGEEMTGEVDTDREAVIEAVIEDIHLKSDEL